MSLDGFFHQRNRQILFSFARGFLPLVFLPLLFIEDSIWYYLHFQTLVAYSKKRRLCWSLHNFSISWWFRAGKRPLGIKISRHLNQFLVRVCENRGTLCRIGVILLLIVLGRLFFLTGSVSRDLRSCKYWKGPSNGVHDPCPTFQSCREVRLFGLPVLW
jgi:hypothetical protein